MARLCVGQILFDGQVGMGAFLRCSFFGIWGRVCAGAGLACSPFRLTQGRPAGGVDWDSALPFCRGVGYDPVWLHMADCPGVVAV